MNIGTCKLCHAEGIELRKSHIIPEFNYKACYDEIHRFHQLSTEGPKHKKLVQKGIRERLLCGKCETRLNRWETYACEVYREREIKLVAGNRLAGVIEGVEYKRFRLYGLSILWRMSISSLRMFEQVRLGPHENVIRRALLAEDPLEPSQYPLILGAVYFRGRFAEDVIVSPSLIKDGGHHHYRLVIAGLHHSFFVGSHPLDPELGGMAISKSGRLTFMRYPLEKMAYLHEGMRELSLALRA